MAKKQRNIISDPNIMMGKPVVAGTRVTVESLLERLGAGESMKQILEAHPQLKKADIHAAILFASRAMKADAVYPVAS